MSSSGLGEFLRASRARLDPDDVGLPYVGMRRVAGLRREEVAALAGVSADYYTRLEQGRERNPSGQVVEAIARALRLDTDGKEHLLRLAGVIPGPVRSVEDDLVEPAFLKFMESIPHPAYIMNRILDVLAVNQLAAAIFSPVGVVDNIARMLFLDPAARDFLPQWHVAARYAVDMLHLALGFSSEDEELTAFIDELIERSSDFETLWKSNSARGLTQHNDLVFLPDLGTIEFTSIAFDIRGASGQQLIVIFTEPGSPSAQLMEELRSGQVRQH